MVNVGIVQHDLAAPTQAGSAVGLALDEAVHQPVAEIGSARPLRQVEAGIADAVVDAVDVERVPHHAVADAKATAGPRRVAEEDDLAAVELDAGRARGDRGVEIQIAADVARPGHAHLAERDGDAEPGGAVGDPHRFMHLAGRGLAAPVRFPHRVDSEQRRLGLDVVNVRRVADPRVGHRRADSVCDLLHHRGPADVLGQDRRTHGGAHGEASQVLGTGFVVAGKDGRMRREHAVAAARPDHGDFADLLLAARAVLEQDSAKGGVRQDAREVVDPAVALGLADHGHDLIRRHTARHDQLVQAGSVRD